MGSALAVWLFAAPVSAQCVGDCSGMNVVRINDLVLGVNISLGTQPLSRCEAFDCQHNGNVGVNCLIQGVNNSLKGCAPIGNTPTATVTAIGDTPTATVTAIANTPTATVTAIGNTPTVTVTAIGNTPTVTVTAIGDTPTATVTAIGNTPTATSSVVVNTPTTTATTGDTPTPTATNVADTPTATPTTGVSCPLLPGIYTVTQVEGGTLDVYSFAPFPFPSGGMIVQHVGAGDANCVHESVVPFPGGFSSPNFCVPALMFTTSVTQTGCGAGRIDSNGGSDFTMNEVADTSDAGCGFTSACTNGANKAIRADVTVGNGSADTCASGGTANALVTVPVHTKSWSDTSGGTYLGCPGNGVFDGTDMVAAEFDQILDFTTDTASGKWMDLDSDGCTLAGFGPAAGYTKSGKCIDAGSGTITAVAVGEFGATGGLFDGTFATVLPSMFTGPTGAASATCASPPQINFGGGTVTRCIP
jgi:hypothetical protein